MKYRAWPKKAGLLALVALLLAALGGCALTTRLGLTGDRSPAQLLSTLDVSRETRALEFSPDGNNLAVFQPDLSEIQIWDWQNKRITEGLPASHGPDSNVSSRLLRFSPDGRLLAACMYLLDGSIAAQIWNTANWMQELSITDRGHTGGCNAVDFTRDGRSLLRLVDRPSEFEQDSIVVYNTRTWKIRLRLHLPGFHPYSLSMSRDGHIVALGGERLDGVVPEKQIVLLDMANMRPLRVMQSNLTGHSGHITWSADGNYIAATGAEGMELFDAHTGKMLADDKNGGRGALAGFSPDGRYLVESGFDRAGDITRIWDAGHRTLLQEIAFKPTSMAISRSGNYFALGNDRMVQIWQFN